MDGHGIGKFEESGRIGNRTPGRPKAPGKYYRFGYRFRPGFDTPELEALLEQIDNAPQDRRPAILRAALMGGAKQAQEAAASEGSEIASAIDDMFSDF